MEKTKFLYLFSLFLMLGLVSFTKSYHLDKFKCPKNYFINPTYECSPCKEGQELDIDGNCVCKGDTIMNLLDRTCRSCPSDSIITGSGDSCDCTANEKKTYFNETAWECQVPTKRSCNSDQYHITYRAGDLNKDLYDLCIDCPDGKDGAGYCNCGTDEIFSYYYGKCSKKCDTGSYFSFYYGKCISGCNLTDPDNFIDYDEIPCSCPDNQFFNTLKASCETLPDTIEKQNVTYYARVRCKDENSILDLENNDCISCGDEAFAFDGECFCNDLTKKYDNETQKCVSCGDYKFRSKYYDNECDSCMENHFEHWYIEEEEIKLKCIKCPYKSTASGCVCKNPFETFDPLSEKCFSCGKGAHFSEESFQCECDDDDKFYDDDLRKCIKCPEGALPSTIPFTDSKFIHRMTCVCPPGQIYHKKDNKCLPACSEKETFGLECLPCPPYSYSTYGKTTTCTCTYGSWDYETQTCKPNGEWSSSSYLKFCFGLILLILLL